ncbi:unnamed protein product [Prorocentrum cordatum]|uniref:Dolichol kinase n=1 Tax=Prorocentrum cordatum TaxID=2364126 RepID=A0ABN9VHU6_9DINO|nr:unnamed protein product [Polarella glacialis]
MVNATAVATLLGRYADLCGVLALFPILMHVKFGSLIRAQTARRKAQETQPPPGTPDATPKDEKKGKPSAKAKAAPAAAAGAGEQGRTPADGTAAGAGAAADNVDSEEAADCVPPAWVFVMLMLAEVLASIQLLDPKDKQARRATGDMLRANQKADGTVTSLVKVAEKLSGNSDVYEMICFIVTCGALLGLGATVQLGLHVDTDWRSGDPGIGSVKSSVIRAIGRSFRAVSSPRPIAIVLLLVLFANWGAVADSPLARFLQRSGMVDLVRSAAGIVRAWACCLAVLAAPWRGPVPAWAAMEALAAAARGARVYVRERVHWQVLLQLSAASRAKHDVIRGALSLELLAFLALLPCAASQGRWRLLLPVLLAPVLVALREDEMVDAVEGYLEQAASKMVMSFCLVALGLVFMGGLPTMASSLLVTHGLITIHKLDKVKP